MLPGVLSARTVSRSPFLRFYAAAASSAASSASAVGASNASAAAAAADDATIWSRRPTLLFFHGSLCWQTYDRVRGMAAHPHPNPHPNPQPNPQPNPHPCPNPRPPPLPLAKVRGMAALARKCKRAHGFIEKYSFGVRYEVRALVTTPNPTPYP